MEIVYLDVEMVVLVEVFEVYVLIMIFNLEDVSFEDLFFEDVVFIVL